MHVWRTVAVSVACGRGRKFGALGQHCQLTNTVKAALAARTRCPLAVVGRIREIKTAAVVARHVLEQVVAQVRQHIALVAPQFHCLRYTNTRGCNAVIKEDGIWVAWARHPATHVVRGGLPRQWIADEPTLTQCGARCIKRGRIGIRRLRDREIIVIDQTHHLRQGVQHLNGRSVDIDESRRELAFKVASQPQAAVLGTGALAEIDHAIGGCGAGPRVKRCCATIINNERVQERRSTRQAGVETNAVLLWRGCCGDRAFNWWRHGLNATQERWPTACWRHGVVLRGLKLQAVVVLLIGAVTENAG